MNTTERKAEQLGMPYGTAMARLRKMILFHLIKRLNKDRCFRCGETIKDIDELSVDHKVPWRKNSPRLFWDMENIAFSHWQCNTEAADRKRPARGIGSAHRKTGPPGTVWYCVCKQFLPADRFAKKKQNWDGYAHYCKTCRSARNW